MARWKSKAKNTDSDNKAVVYTDKKTQLITIAKKLLILGVIAVFAYGMFWMYNNGKLGKFSSPDSRQSESETQNLSNPEQQLKIELEKADKVGPPGLKDQEFITQ